MSKYHPTKDAARLFGLFGGGLFIVFCIMAVRFGGSDKGLSLMTAISIGILTLIGVVWANHRHRHYVLAERAYLARRRAVEQKLDKPRKNPKAPSTEDESTDIDRPAQDEQSTKRRETKRSPAP